MRFLVLSIVLLMPGVLSRAVLQDTVRYLGPDAFYIEIHSSVAPLVLDVREEEEYLRERIPGSVSAPQSEVLYGIIDTIDTEHRIFIYCDLTDRSKTVASLLKEQGFIHLFLLEGGISAWKATSLPLDRQRLKKRDLGY